VESILILESVIDVPIWHNMDQNKLMIFVGWKCNIMLKWNIYRVEYEIRVLI